jgi:uncharacterized repeat protein (TIGR04076 family)
VILAGRAMSKLIIEVSEIRGKCPVYKIGDKIVIDGPEIVLEKTDAICIHALAPLLHYIVALRDGTDPSKLGLSKNGNMLTSNALILESLIQMVGELSLNATKLI